MLPGGKDPGHLLCGAAEEQQRQRREHAEGDHSQTQPAGPNNRQAEPSHHNSAQDGAQNGQRDAHSS